MRKRVVVAMSGGVDSSAAAALMVEAGHEVIGLSMKTHRSAPKGAKACCTPDDMRDARRVADTLGIPFYLLNYEELFEREVIAPFAEAYAQGRTPNPCVDCNDKVKFVPLLERAKLLGADCLVTGHYAQIIDCEDGTRRLQRGRDPMKDQSYFLYRLTQSQLAQLSFPLGDMHKDEVRAHAERLGLDIANKRESQEICFVGSAGYADTVEKILGHSLPGGDIVHEDGTVLGKHQGIHRYTTGQRRGLGISHPEPLYVTEVEPASNLVKVGSARALKVTGVNIHQTRWPGPPPEVGTEVRIQQRYREVAKPGRVVGVTEAGRTVQVAFETPAPAGAPGQAAVLYDGDTVLGGGVIEAVVGRNSGASTPDTGLPRATESR